MGVENKANIVAVMGGSGSGKSTFIKREIERLKPKRLIVFDVMHEYHSHATPVTTLSDLVKACAKPTFKVTLQANNRVIDDQFNFICGLAFELRDLVFVTEELNRVTQANRAPPNWQDCTSRGRHRGLSIYGASQRPASVDKDFFSNATRIRTGRLNFAADIKTLADVLNVKHADVAGLLPLEFIEKDTNTHVVTRGKLKF